MAGLDADVPASSPAFLREGQAEPNPAPNPLPIPSVCVRQRETNDSTEPSLKLREHHRRASEQPTRRRGNALDSECGREIKDGEAFHRAVRYDVFRVQDRDDFIIEDANDESGTAWTFAYAFSPNTRHRFTAELLHVDSTRANRRDIGLAPRAIEILGTLSWRVSF